MTNLASAFDKHEAVYRAQVQAETWGHLAPEPRRVYHGHILFAFGCFGDHQIIETDFDDLPSSPWFYDDVNDFVSRFIEKKAAQGTLYKFEGHYIKFKNGGYAFRGVTNVVRVDYARRTG